MSVISPKTLVVRKREIYFFQMSHMDSFFKQWHANHEKNLNCTNFTDVDEETTPRNSYWIRIMTLLTPPARIHRWWRDGKPKPSVDRSHARSPEGGTSRAWGGGGGVTKLRLIRKRAGPFTARSPKGLRRCIVLRSRGRQNDTIKIDLSRTPVHNGT